MSGLRILSFGAGAIGTYIGGSLALQGSQVVFVERPSVVDELRGRGLKLRLPDGEHTIQNPLVVPSVHDALTYGPFDAAVFAVKSYDTAAALAGLREVQDRLPPFISLQNGVENEGLLAEFLSPERVIPATVTSAVGRRGAGDIFLERLRGMGVAAGHPLSLRLVEELNRAGLQAKLYPNAAAMKWSKMLTNLIANATSAILDMPPAEIFKHPDLFRLEVAQLQETLQVMAAGRIPVVNLPGTPVRLLAFGVQRLPARLLQPLLQKAAGSGRGGKMPSFHIDLHTGRGQSEVDYLNGAVVRAGQRLGIPAPVNLVLKETLLALTAGTQSKETYAHRPDVLLMKLEEHTGTKIRR